MKNLSCAEKILIKNMMRSTLERAFNNQVAHELCMTYDKAVFREVEYSEWYKKGENILAENIDTIFAALMRDAGKFMFEGEFEQD